MPKLQSAACRRLVHDLSVDSPATFTQMLLGQRFVENATAGLLALASTRGRTLAIRSVAAFGIGTGAVELVEPRAELKGQPEVDELLIVLQPEVRRSLPRRRRQPRARRRSRHLVLNNAQENL